MALRRSTEGYVPIYRCEIARLLQLRPAPCKLALTIAGFRNYFGSDERWLKIRVEKDQMLTTHRELAELSSLSKSAVGRGLTELVAEGVISTRTISGRVTLITYLVSRGSGASEESASKPGSPPPASRAVLRRGPQRPPRKDGHAPNPANPDKTQAAENWEKSEKVEDERAAALALLRQYGAIRAEHGLKPVSDHLALPAILLALTQFSRQEIELALQSISATARIVSKERSFLRHPNSTFHFGTLNHALSREDSRPRRLPSDKSVVEQCRRERAQRAPNLGELMRQAAKEIWGNGDGEGSPQ